MTCVSCSTVWCYLCGLSVEECDKAPRTGGEPIYGHNQGWETNSRRCPMYIGMIARVDEDWNLEEEVAGEDGSVDMEQVEEKCLDKFHKWRALKQLSALRAELGPEKWNLLRETFPAVRNCGFTDQEIATAGEMPLFNRRG